MFELLARKYHGRQIRTGGDGELVTGVPAAQTRAIAAQIAHAAFEKAMVIDQPWTDFNGERHEKMIGRPVSFHAMRGISAHSNGFQTRPRAASAADPDRIDRYARRLSLQATLPQASRGASNAAWPPIPMQRSRCQGRIWVSREGPEQLLLEDDGITRVRIDKAFSWDAPFSAHGLMHMVISNAHARRSLPASTCCSSTWPTWPGTRR